MVYGLWIMGLTGLECVIMSHITSIHYHITWLVDWMPVIESHTAIYLDSSLLFTNFFLSSFLYHPVLPPFGAIP